MKKHDDILKTALFCEAILELETKSKEIPSEGVCNLIIKKFENHKLKHFKKDFNKIYWDLMCAGYIYSPKKDFLKRFDGVERVNL